MSSISRLAGVRVLTVGDVMLDEYIWGEVGRISPEAPVPVVDVRRRTHAAGGAANVAAGVVALSGSAVISGVLGDDVTATTLTEALHSAGVDVSALVTDGSRPTTCKTRVVAHAQQVVRFDVETGGELSETVARALVDQVLEHLPGADAVVISDYRKGVACELVCRELIAAATAAGKPVVVDPKSVDYGKYRGATVITPNVHDAGLSANVHVHSDADLVEVAHRLQRASRGAALLITRGAAGMSLFDGQDRFDVPTQARSVYDVTGAGDTVVATLAVALGRGVPLQQAIVMANIAAGIVVGKMGTSTVSVQELERSVRSIAPELDA